MINPVYLRESVGSYGTPEYVPALNGFGEVGDCFGRDDDVLTVASSSCYS